MMEADSRMLFGESREGSDSSGFDQQLVERRAAGQTAETLAERRVYVFPFLAGRAPHVARFLVRPLAGFLAMRVSPQKNLRFRESW